MSEKTPRTPIRDAVSWSARMMSGIDVALPPKRTTPRWTDFTMI